jgi:SPP1 gp7 family putative phage head morphogenesis protein
VKSEDYWQKRFEAQKVRAERDVAGYVDALQAEYAVAQADLQKDIDAWYARFAENNEIDLAEAKRLLTTTELEEFKWTVDEYIQHANGSESKAFAQQLENASTRVRVSRLEALQLQLQEHVERVGGAQSEGLEALLRSTYDDQHLRTQYEVERGLGVGTSFARYDEAQLENALRSTWAPDGSNWSERIWKNRTQLAGEVQAGLMQGLIRGDNPRELTETLVKRFNVSRSAAARLAQTEAAYMAEIASKDTYEEMGIEEIQLLCTLDSDTCAACGDLDGNTLAEKDVVPGVTAPPFHANCRCTTIPYFPDDKGFRAARDKDGELYNVPGDETYEQWKERGAVRERNEAAAEQEKQRAKEEKTAKGLQNPANGGILEQGEIMRIPQISAKHVRDRIESGEYSTKQKRQKYLQHTEGTAQFKQEQQKRAARGDNPQSILTVSENDAQRIIIERAGTGIVRPKTDGTPSNKEQINSESVIGKYWGAGAYHETTKAAIHHGPKGAHIVPIRGDHFD